MGLLESSRLVPASILPRIFELTISQLDDKMACFTLLDEPFHTCRGSEKTLVVSLPT